MSRSNWDGPHPLITGITITFIIIASSVIIWKLAEGNTRYSQHAEYASKEYEDRAVENIVRSCTNTDIAVFSECVHKEIDSSKENSRAEDDLAAQKGMALWAKLMAAVSAGTLILTGLALYFIWRTMDFTSDTLIEAKGQANMLRLQMIAYPEFKATFSGANLIQISIEVENKGNTKLQINSTSCYVEVVSNDEVLYSETIYGQAENRIAVGGGDKGAIIFSSDTSIVDVFPDSVTKFQSREAIIRTDFKCEYANIFGDITPKRQTENIYMQNYPPSPPPPHSIGMEQPDFTDQSFGKFMFINSEIVSSES